MSSNVKLFSKFPNEVFIETGTWSGDGVQRAIEAGFFQIKSVESSADFYEYSKNLFLEEKKVELFFGKSEDHLWEMIKDVTVPITFWLDAHYSEGQTTNDFPLLKELDIISKHPIKNHVILIDDVRQMDTPAFGGIKREDVEKKIKNINNNYLIEYHDGYVANDVMVAIIKE
jgi:hypothetical protein